MRIIVLTLVCFLFCCANNFSNAECSPTLTFDEYANLANDKNYSDEVTEKVGQIFNFYELDNSISADHEFNGKIRVVSWDISGGEEFEKLNLILAGDFKNSAKYLSQRCWNNSERLNKYKSDLGTIKDADVIILLNADKGQPRSEYRDVAKELAAEHGYNYLYTVNFIGVESDVLESANPPDKEKYLGYTGTAILSKYPLSNIRKVNLPQYYDWYNDEKALKLDLAKDEEKFPGVVQRSLYNITPDTKLGGRMALIADIQPAGAAEPITIAAVETENRTAPQNRLSQFQTLLNAVAKTDNPVIIGGNLNTTGLNESPFNIEKFIKEKLTADNAALAVISATVTNGSVLSLGARGFNKVRMKTDPTGANIPLVYSNKERKLFDEIRDFTFLDGCKFATNSDGKTSAQGSDDAKFLANSNEYANGRFVPTYYYNGFFAQGRYKTDWFIVKKLNPESPSTLGSFYTEFDVPVSTHAPIVITVSSEK